MSTDSLEEGGEAALAVVARGEHNALNGDNGFSATANWSPEIKHEHTLFEAPIRSGHSPLEDENLRQNAKGQRIAIEPTRDAKLTEFGKTTLRDRYLLPGESYQDMFARVVLAFADDSAHAQRLYDYISNLWFMPATPVLSNGGAERGLPISCFVNESADSLEGIIELWQENVWLAARGGGIGSYWGNLRSIGEKVGRVGHTSGIIPFVKVMDSQTLAISQGSLRRGSAAVYVRIDHPEIEEFIDLRKPTGGDVNRRSLNLHHGIVITDAFMQAVRDGEQWALRSPRDHSVIRRVSARNLWIRLLTARLETGEPYLLFIDHINRAIPEHHKLSGLEVKTSNLCSEITLPTGEDHLQNWRTAVCCLSSVNLEHFETWQKDENFIDDLMRFLDNVLEDFITNAPPQFERAIYAATRERSIGLGAMGFHSFLQKKGLPFDGLMARSWNKTMFKHIRTHADKASIKLAIERGPCPDADEHGIKERFSSKLAIAPTASISIICGGASPGIEPYNANAFVHKTLSGSFAVRNPILKETLAEKGLDTEETWRSIADHGGSVQHLKGLNADEKAVFKTAFEIDQRALIAMAADRAPFICQSQSLNVFLPGNVHKQDLHDIHWQAWEKGIKSLYYCRSHAVARTDSLSSTAANTNGHATTNAPANAPTDDKECEVCQ